MESVNEVLKKLLSKGWIVSEWSSCAGHEKVTILNGKGEQLNFSGFECGISSIARDVIGQEETSDEALAQKVKDAVKSLNDVVSDACNNGLNVGIEHIENYQIGKRVVTPIVSVKISRPLI